MNQEKAKQTYRGVRCLSCRQPIPLPGILRKLGCDLDEKDPGAVPEHAALVFSLRCRACEREKPYRTTDILDFEGEPRNRNFRPRVIQRQEHRSESYSRAANA
jgi:hypothetical protein